MVIGFGLGRNNPMFSLKSTNSVNATIAAMHRATEKANSQIASHIAATAQANAPVQAGELRDSIVATESGVEVTAPHALFVEIGTEHQAAQPFLSPAVQDHADDYAIALKEALK